MNTPQPVPSIWEKIWGFLWVDHGTKSLGILIGVLGALTSVPDLLSPHITTVLLGVMAVLVYVRGFINSEFNK